MKEKLICTFPGCDMMPPIFMGDRDIYAVTWAGAFHFHDGSMHTLLDFEALGRIALPRNNIYNPYMHGGGPHPPLLVNDAIYILSEKSVGAVPPILSIFSRTDELLQEVELEIRSVRWMGASDDHLFTLGYQQAFVMDTSGRCLHKVDIDWQSMDKTPAVIYKDSMLFIDKKDGGYWLFRLFADGTLEAVHRIAGYEVMCPAKDFVVSGSEIYPQWFAVGELEFEGSAFFIFREYEPGRLLLRKCLLLGGQNEDGILKGGFPGGFCVNGDSLLYTDDYMSVKRTKADRFPSVPNGIYGRLITASTVDGTYTAVKIPFDFHKVAPAPIIALKDGTIASKWYSDQDYPLYVVQRDGTWQAGPTRRAQYLVKYNEQIYACDVGGKNSKIRQIQF